MYEEEPLNTAPAGPSAESTRPSLGFLLLLAIAGAPVLAGAIHLLPAGLSDPAVLRQHVASFGPWAPAVYVGVLAFRPFLFLPAAPLMMAGGLVFGTGWGAFLTTCGLVLAACTAYALARYLGHPFVQRHLGPALGQLATTHFTEGVVFMMNIFPICPLSLPNYGAGLAALPVLPFLAATAAGLAPRVLAWSAVGSMTVEFRAAHLVGAVAVLGLLMLLPVIFPSLRPKRAAPAPAPEPGDPAA